MEITTAAAMLCMLMTTYSSRLPIAGKDKDKKYSKDDMTGIFNDNYINSREQTGQNFGEEA